MDGTKGTGKTAEEKLEFRDRGLLKSCGRPQLGQAVGSGKVQKSSHRRAADGSAAAAAASTVACSSAAFAAANSCCCTSCTSCLTPLSSIISFTRRVSLLRRQRLGGS